MLTFNNLAKTLSEIYDLVGTVSDTNTYSKKGDSIIFWPSNSDFPIKASFFGEEFESIDFVKMKDNEIKQKDTNIVQELTASNSKEYLENLISKSTNWIDFIIFFEIRCIPSDYVVHEDHGVAQFDSIVKKDDNNYLLLIYAGGDKLYIPVTQLKRITKFIGANGVIPKVTRLSGGEWNRILKKVKASTALIAKDLLIQLALREVNRGPQISLGGDLYEKFCNDFPYSLTIDQEQVMNDIEKDLKKSVILPNSGGKTNLGFSMNRLLIGDVGFGKTEIAMRLAFRIVESGFQVAILCPTTILTAQHFKLFKDRFSRYGVSICMLSSFQEASRNTELVKEVNNGKYEIVIGTHRLLSDDVKFKNLGLIIIDEEQRFGVKQKEKIKSLKYGVHILSMSATPIPRTLSMALAKLQDISTITTPPTGRRAIKTEIITNDIERILDKIRFEIDRGGQVYLIHNKIQTIHSLKNKLQELNKNLRIGVAYSGMSCLEETILKFYNEEYDILISTTILENGIDMPNVNTIIINDAQNFGLSELHQLRGRVGRSNIQAYCYLVTKKDSYFRDIITNPKEQRKNIKKQDNLKQVQLDRILTLTEFSELGSGFQIAQRDLELRGAGNILGKEQSGNINLVGYGLYLKLLEEEISKLSIT